MNTRLLIATIAIAGCALHTDGVQAGEKAFAKIVPALTGAPPEGFTIGKGSTAYNSSIDGSIYKVDLRSGEGEVLVEADPDFDILSDTDYCYKLGMRVDPRSNYLFAAGCLRGNALVFDADTGAEIADYQLASFGNIINDLAITRDAVYFTDFSAPFLYRLPLSRNGRLPDAAAVLPIPLAGDNPSDPLASPMTANGIVATPNGDTLIIGDSRTASIYRVDPATGHSDRIVVDPPLVGFIDGIVLHKGMLYILTPGGDGSGEDWIQVVVLDKDLLTGTRIGIITDPDLEGVASGAMFGGTLYVNNARYEVFPEPDTEYWLTRLQLSKFKR
jgi:sugar lactone lactonase YvrE